MNYGLIGVGNGLDFTIKLMLLMIGVIIALIALLRGGVREPLRMPNIYEEMMILNNKVARFVRRV